MCRYWSSPVRVLKGLTSNNGKNKIYFIFSTHKSHFGFIVQGGFFYVRPAWAITWRWKSATGLAVGTVSKGQGCPPWGGIWRKPNANPWSDEQKPHIRHLWDGRACITKQSPILPESHSVNVADIWGEGYRSYLGRSCKATKDKLPLTPVEPA